MPQRVHESVEVRAPLGEVFDYWVEPRALPRDHEQRRGGACDRPGEESLEGQGSCWYQRRVRPRTTEMDPDRGIGWNSVEGEVDTSGEVRFEKVASDRTRIEVTMNYADPPGGKVGEVVADAISNPERMMREDLENFAARVERGEVEFAGPGAPAQYR